MDARRLAPRVGIDHATRGAVATEEDQRHDGAHGSRR
jgi:hypothetical protein